MTPENQDLAQLLAHLSTFISRFVTLSSAQADICALWVVHTHSLDAADFTPYLAISSPVLRSGKTRLLEVLRLLVAKPWFTARVSAAVLVRRTDQDHPTLLLDESDAAFNQGEYSEALRGILNSGFERDGVQSICIPSGQEWTASNFSTFSPKAIAGIGKLPPTVGDRAIPIRLKRALRSDERQRLRKGKVKPEADRLHMAASEWATQNLTRLREREPELPEQLNDRQQDVCEPLLAIADCAGSEWPLRARRALISLCGSVVEPEDGIQGVTLLSDVRTVFCRCGADRIPTQDLLKELRRIETSPWAEADRGKPLSPYRLSKLLAPFGIGPKDIRFSDITRKGYLRSDFEDSWARYLPVAPEKGQQRQQGSIHAGPSDFGQGQHEGPVAATESAESSINTRIVADVALSSPSWSELGVVNSSETTTNLNGSRHCWIHPTNKTE